MRGTTQKALVMFMAFAFVFASFVMVAPAEAKMSAAELEKAKKAGDQTDEALAKAREAFGQEADEANVEATERTLKKKGAGNSTYGVAGFDYLTGVGKVASDPDRINETTFKIKKQIKSPLNNLMKKRFKTKWTGQYNDTHSGWTQETGVTEVWFRGASKDKNLGGDYNEWVNQWNNITRPRHDNKTQVAGADPDQGAHWFSFYCVHCHGWSGKGDGPTAATLDPRPRNLTNGRYANNISNIAIFTVIKGGGIARNLSESMPPWGNIMQDQDIWNTVAFIRSLAAKPTYVADPTYVTAAGAAKSEDFQDMNEELELEGVMAGRGIISGGSDSIGGGRLSSKQVGVKAGVKTSDAGEAKSGDWMLDK